MTPLITVPNSSSTKVLLPITAIFQLCCSGGQGIKASIRKSQAWHHWTRPEIPLWLFCVPCTTESTDILNSLIQGDWSQEEIWIQGWLCQDPREFSGASHLLPCLIVKVNGNYSNQKHTGTLWSQTSQELSFRFHPKKCVSGSVLAKGDKSTKWVTGKGKFCTFTHCMTSYISKVCNSYI